MKSLSARLEHFLLGHPDYANLDQRFFHVVCLGGSLAALLSIPVNFFVVSGWFLTTTNIIETVILVSAYLYSRVTGRYRQITWVTILSLLLFLSTQWFHNGGSTGGAQYYFLILALAGSVIFKGRQRVLFMVLITINVTSLILTEYMHPTWVTYYDNIFSRSLDVTFSFILTMLLSAVAVSFLSIHNSELVARTARLNAELKEDLILARMLQEGLYERETAQVSHTDLALLYKPSRTIGGDFYEIRHIPGGLRILLADMKGHGINAALSAMLVKREWSLAGHNESDPGEALRLFNDHLVERYENSFLLGAFLVDMYEDRFVFASAGFPNQYLVEDHSVKSLEASGPLLGVLPDQCYDSTTMNIKPDSRLFLFSDALVEEYNQMGRLQGDGWLCEALSRPFTDSGQLMNAVLDRFTAITGRKPGEMTDDLTMVVTGPFRD